MQVPVFSFNCLQMVQSFFIAVLQFEELGAQTAGLFLRRLQVRLTLLKLHLPVTQQLHQRKRITNQCTHLFQSLPYCFLPCLQALSAVVHFLRCLRLCLGLWLLLLTDLVEVALPFIQSQSSSIGSLQFNHQVFNLCL